MTIRLTRRAFLRQAGFGTAAAMLDPTAVIRWFSEFPKPVLSPKTKVSLATFEFAKHLVQWSASPEAPSDDEIPTQFFSSGYTQDQLEKAWASGDLTNGFPWGVADTHTLGGIPDPKNVTIDNDGSAVLTIRRPTPQELSDWQADAGTSALLREGEKNGIEMKLAVAAFTGRLPTDAQSIEASITPPQGIQTGDLKVGMVGIGWTFWTLPDLERLTSELTKVGASAQEIQEISSRVNIAEEDIGEFSLGRPTLELGYPLWITILGGQIMTFMAGRKTFTKRCPRADIMQMLYEPFDFPARPLMPLLMDRTISGWLSEHVGDRTGSVRTPFKVKLEIGKEVYDSTRDAMAAPMTFSLNDKPLTPTATSNFPGFEIDKTGSTPANLSLTRLRTREGEWVSIPRRFIIDFCSSSRRKVEGETDQVRFSNVIITRRKDSPPS